ncbi:ER to Golgi transport-related protein [Gigaspora margarita]|uniref:ER to Golgi transport-related protein n=1 Tax=Gigaspora margarita TaxID=4874 RepID=A0A8H3XGZ5_GIGMA|nr:ER to Golgi transport-related protein [Gigaspora margarita]
MRTLLTIHSLFIRSQVVDNFSNFKYAKCDLELAGINSDKAFGALLKYNGKLNEKTDAYIQCALSYTTSMGQRRVTNKRWKVDTNSWPDAVLLLSAINLHGVDMTI